MPERYGVRLLQTDLLHGGGTMTRTELGEVICELHRRIALTTAGTPLQDDLIKATGALRIAVNRITELEARLPKDGEWALGIDADGDPVIYCTNCMMPTNVKTNYCPDCGAKMKGEQE